ncbi:hypothetical protein [Endozoicomonas sp. OPT23]|uniref:hypothetical protein n=1 Tax=Endozoicomonas sp. OPT23 TaxID=2072845 RepID=UPI00129B785C|nr:hypothetical protein [Endozoicomonas sp. OPT23]
MKNNEINTLILWVIILAVVTPLAFIGGMIFGGSLQTEFTLTADSASSWVAAIATVSIAILTFILAKETWHLRAAQSEQLEQLRLDAIRPSVDFNFKISDVHVQLLELEIKNCGKGIAQNVSFEFLSIDNESEPENNPILDKLKDLGAIKYGIASLGIDQLYTTFMFSFIDIMGVMGEEETFATKFIVKIVFSDSNGHQYTNAVTIDFSQFIGVVHAGGGSPTHNISKNIEKIAKWAESLTRSRSKRITVNTFSSEEREQEEKEFERIRQEQQASR